MHGGGRGDRAQGGPGLRPLAPRAPPGAAGGGDRLTGEPKIAAAPITWGVSEVPGWGRQLDPDRVLAEIARTGLKATELGPRGFLPDDPAGIRTRLAAHGLRLVGGFLPVVLHREALREEALAEVDACARTLAGAGAEVLVLAAATSVDGYDASFLASDSEWAALREGLARVQGIGRRHELAVAFHPHIGTVVEREDQVRRLIATTDVPICLDTGHLAVAGADPVEVARAARGRVAHVHLKDVDPETAGRVRFGELAYREAVRRGLYRPLGQGSVDLANLIERLRSDGYRGWYVLEQDLVLKDGDGTRPLENARASLSFLRTLLAA